MGANHACKYFENGVVFTGDGYEPSEPPYCEVKDVRGSSVCDDTKFPCEGCTDFVLKDKSDYPF